MYEVLKVLHSFYLAIGRELRLTAQMAHYDTHKLSNSTALTPLRILEHWLNPNGDGCESEFSAL